MVYIILTHASASSIRRVSNLRCSVRWFIHKLKAEYFSGLKGQNILAQGKRSVAMGCKTSIKIVREITFFEVLSLFRTKRHEFQIRPKGVSRPDYCICADVFLFIPFTPGEAWG